MNRKQRRAGKLPANISDLPEDQRKVMCALIQFWLEESEVGQEIRRRQRLSVERAIDLICSLHAKGLVRFRFGPGTPLKDAPFYVEPLLPMGGWEGSRA